MLYYRLEIYTNRRRHAHEVMSSNIRVVTDFFKLIHVYTRIPRAKTKLSKLSTRATELFFLLTRKTRLL